ncbi:hypothetical protein PC123_g10381 [Phytophthora cactorum]|nr:hypothetical protein PC123_g10381 [Phytophthora cactorum]
MRDGSHPERQGKDSNEVFQTDKGGVFFLLSGEYSSAFPRRAITAIWFFLTNMEISISEGLGHVALFESGDLRFGGEPCAIVASDSVDEDELSPYQPSEHIRKDISGGVVMTASRQKKLVTVEEDGEATPDDDEIVVTMRRAGYLKIHRPEFPIWPLAQQELEGGIGAWGKVMIKTMRELLYAIP